TELLEAFFNEVENSREPNYNFPSVVTSDASLTTAGRGHSFLSTSIGSAHGHREARVADPQDPLRRLPARLRHRPADRATLGGGLPRHPGRALSRPPAARAGRPPPPRLACVPPR